MKLTTYFGQVEPKTVYRVVVTDGKVDGFMATPKAPRWRRSRSVEAKLQDRFTDAVKITRDEALTILNNWGGAPDEIDGSSWVSMPDFTPGQFAAKLEVPRPSPSQVLAQDWSLLGKPVPVATLSSSLPPRKPLQPVLISEPFELWREPESTVMVQARPQTVPAPAAPPAVQETVVLEVQREVKVDRPAALSVLRDLADGLGLGQAGVGWT